MYKLRRKTIINQHITHASLSTIFWSSLRCIQFFSVQSRRSRPIFPRGEQHASWAGEEPTRWIFLVAFKVVLLLSFEYAYSSKSSIDWYPSFSAIAAKRFSIIYSCLLRSSFAKRRFLICEHWVYGWQLSYRNWLTVSSERRASSNPSFDSVVFSTRLTIVDICAEALKSERAVAAVYEWPRHEAREKHMMRVIGASVGLTFGKGTTESALPSRTEVMSVNARDDLPRVSLESVQDWKRIRANFEKATYAAFEERIASSELGLGEHRQLLQSHIKQVGDAFYWRRAWI